MKAILSNLILLATLVVIANVVNAQDTLALKIKLPVTVNKISKILKHDNKFN